MLETPAAEMAAHNAFISLYAARKLFLIGAEASAEDITGIAGLTVLVVISNHELLVTVLY